MAGTPRQRLRLSTGRRAALIGALAVLLIVGSVASVAILRHALAKPDGYLSVTANELIYLQFTEDTAHHLTGNWQEEHVDSPGTVSCLDIGIAGVLDGSQITLTYSEAGVSVTLQGTLDGDTLTLQAPGQNGAIAPVVLHGATVEDYNNAVAQLHQRAGARACAWMGE